MKGLILSIIPILILSISPTLFAQETAPENVIGNKDSMLYHLFSSSHLPQEELQQAFSNKTIAESGGFEPCIICFRKKIEINDYELEKMLGKECEAKVRYYYQVAIDPELQGYLEKMGNEVVNNWPGSILPYDYTFRVIDDDHINAVACPTGYIFVTTAMMEAIESDNELRAILAHEVTHVNNRDGLHLYSNRKTGALLAALAGVAVGLATQNVTVMDISQSIAQIASTIVLLGYSRKQETKADSEALGYLLNYQDNSEEGLLLILKKLSDISDSSTPSLFSTHPNIEDRITNVEKLLQYYNIIENRDIARYHGVIDIEEIRKSEGTLRGYRHLDKAQPQLIVTDEIIIVYDNLILPITTAGQYRFVFDPGARKTTEPVSYLGKSILSIGGKNIHVYEFERTNRAMSSEYIIANSTISLFRKTGPRGYRDIIAFTK